MLKELKNKVYQDKSTHRRWFEGDQIELIVWYDKQNEISGFQICYKQTLKEKALTWKQKTGFSHDTIDTGETIPTEYKKSPILVPDGKFDKEKIAELFRLESVNLEQGLADFILDKIREY